MNDAKYAAELVRRAKVIRQASGPSGGKKNPFDFKACERKAKKKGITSPGAYCATIDRRMNPGLIHAYSLAAYPTKDNKFEGVIRDEQTKKRRFSPRFETLQQATFWVKSEAHQVINGKGTLAPMKRKGEYHANVWVPTVESNPEVSDRMHRYRARKNVQPSAPEKCWWCGKKLTKKTALVGHIDGDERNDAKSNLAWTCKSCNAIEAHQHKANGTGRRIA